MNGQNNEHNNQTGQNNQTNQTEQNTNTQQSRTQDQNGGGGFAGFFFPLNFVFRERPREQQQQQQEQTSSPINEQTSSLPQSPPAEDNTRQNGTPQILHFFIYPMPGTDGQTSPGVFFFTPFFMPQEVRKPRASESAIKRLPIVTITEEHVNSQASCPICLEHFSLSTEQEHDPVRQMPCGHVFCESCLFQWLRQNNTCPLCRKEIEAEGAEVQQQNNNNNNNDGETNTPPNITINIVNPPSVSPVPPSTTTTNVIQLHPNSHSHTQNSHSCVLANVGCCEEIDNVTPTPIITLPQCHHRFHASCLRTSLLVEGYSPGDFNSISHPLNFHCPTCRAPAIVQSELLKMPVAPHDEQQQEQQVIPFNLPITIHIPDSDDMDLD